MLQDDHRKGARPAAHLHCGEVPLGPLAALVVDGYNTKSESISQEAVGAFIKPIDDGTSLFEAWLLNKTYPGSRRGVALDDVIVAGKVDCRTVAVNKSLLVWSLSLLLRADGDK